MLGQRGLTYLDCWVGSAGFCWAIFHGVRIPEDHRLPDPETELSIHSFKYATCQVQWRLPNETISNTNIAIRLTSIYIPLIIALGVMAK